MRGDVFPSTNFSIPTAIKFYSFSAFNFPSRNVRTRHRPAGSSQPSILPRLPLNAGLLAIPCISTITSFSNFIFYSFYFLFNSESFWSDVGFTSSLPTRSSYVWSLLCSFPNHPSLPVIGRLFYIREGPCTTSSSSICTRFFS